MTDQKSDSFHRWQGRTIEEMGKIISVIMGMSLATLGFSFDWLLKSEICFCWIKILLTLGLLALLACIIILTVVSINRLSSFRKTAQIARIRGNKTHEDYGKLSIYREGVKRQDNCTWKLFKFALILFALGEVIIAVGFGMKII